MSLPPLTDGSSSPYAARRESKEAALSGGSRSSPSPSAGSRKSSRGGTPQGNKDRSFEGQLQSPTRSSHSPTSKKSNIALYASTAQPVDDDELEKIVVRNSQLNGKEMEYYGSEQAILNMAVKTAVLDNEENLESIHENQIEGCIRMRQTLYMGNEKRRSALKEFDDGYKWCEPTTYDVPDLVNELGLRISLEAIADLGVPLNTPTIFNVPPMLRELLQGNNNKDRLAMIENDLRTVSDALTSRRLQITDSVMNLYELVHTDVLEYITKKLKDMETKMMELMREVDNCEREREAALKTDNIALAQERHHQSVELLWQLIVSTRDRLNEVMMGSNDPDNFRSDFDRFQVDVIGSLAQFKVEKENMKEDIAHDLRVLKETLDERRIANEQAIERAREWQHASNIRLGENARKQDEVWAQVCAMVSDLKKLGEERTKEVQIHIEMHDKEEQRRYEHEDFVLINNKHVKTLEDVMRHTESAIRFTYAIDEYFSQGIQSVQEKRVDVILDEMKATEQKRYFDVFRRYALVTDELIDRKEKRLNGLQRMIRNMEYQQEMAIETLDNDVENYAEQIRQLKDKRDTTQKTIARLQTNMDRAMADFSATEGLMEEMGIEYHPPALEIHEKQIKRRKDFLEKRRQFLDKEQNEIDQDTTDIRKMNSRQNVEHETHAKRKAERERRKAAKAKAQQSDRPSTAPNDEKEKVDNPELAATLPAR